jgi:flavin reductase (DIM6/NTAB) family NADH-FMN oxidoreductase RutF
LSADQRDLSVRFSTLPRDERFRDLAWDSWSRGGPALPGAAATLDCRRVRVVEGGDHLILIGEVEAIRVGDAPAPLVYHRGGYRSLAAD